MNNPEQKKITTPQAQEKLTDEQLEQLNAGVNNVIINNGVYTPATLEKAAGGTVGAGLDAGANLPGKQDKLFIL